MFFSTFVSLKQLIFLAFVQGPRLLEQLRVVGAMNWQYVSFNSEVVGPSYDNFNDW